MHRFRSWTLDPSEWRTQRNRLLPIEGGDGSTLSLDFTTGVLDPRLTFTRTTNATFINSSGYVEYAPANMLSNSIFTGASGTIAPTGWQVQFIGGTGNFTLNGSELTISNNNSATRSRIYQTGPTGNGLPMTVQVKIVAKSGTAFGLQELVAFSINGLAPSTPFEYKVNGITQSGTYTGWNANDIVTFTGVPAIGSSATCVFGIGASSAQANDCSVTIKDVQIEPGTVARAYNATTTSGAYQAPRFDYAPTSIGTPRGLLIEGSANNLLLYGQTSFEPSQTSWIRSNGVNVNATNGTGGTTPNPRIDGPDGGTQTGTLITKDASLSSQFVRLSQSVSVSGNQTYTFSVYVRAYSVANPYFRLAAFNGGTWLNTTGATSASGITITDTVNNGSKFNGVPSTGWVRIWVTFTTQALQSSATIAFYPDTETSNAASMYIWGAQVETGSGPSSVIPTGASTGNRAADNCYLTDWSAFSPNWNTAAGTMLVDADVTRISTTAAFPRPFTFTATTNSGSRFGMFFDCASNVYKAETYLQTYYLEQTASITSNGTRFVHAISAFRDTQSRLRGALNGSTITAVSDSPNLGLSSVGGFALNMGTNASCPSTRVRKIKYWPREFSQSELNNISIT